MSSAGVDTTLASVLCCPRCARGALSLERAGWICANCGAGYPLIGELPWLFAEPRFALAEWRGRCGLQIQHLQREAGALSAARAAGQVSTLTGRRLESLAQAYLDQAARLRALLAPLGLDEASIGFETHQALGTRMPLDQGLTNYYVNIHRDWCWGRDENEAALNELRAASNGLAQFGRVLVLGAGAGRLAYDLHQASDASLTVASDFNPLLLFVAREMYAARDLQLYEFPIAPRQFADQAVLRPLRSPGVARAGLALVAADALQAPFMAGSFDVVVTPWFVDIINEPLDRTAGRVNNWLRPGGRWLNFGSLAFARGAHAERLSLEESLDTVATSGFAVQDVRETTIPYMHSPASRHGRMETTVTWAATKNSSAPAVARERQWPDWLLRSDRPVPRTARIESAAIASRVHAFLLALINGDRSLRDMAAVLVEQRLMSAAESESAVRQFLVRLHEEGEQRTDF
jgi:SAM-dependent methyltransferase/uncharacterized protein YbaR (Trm112 family)